MFLHVLDFVISLTAWIFKKLLLTHAQVVPNMSPHTICSQICLRSHSLKSLVLKTPGPNYQETIPVTLMSNNSLTSQLLVQRSCVNMGFSLTDTRTALAKRCVSLVNSELTLGNFFFSWVLKIYRYHLYLSVSVRCLFRSFAHLLIRQSFENPVLNWIDRAFQVAQW